MRYAPHENLVAPARASSHPLRLLGGMALTIALFITLAIAFSELARSVLGPAPVDDSTYGATPMTVMLLLSEFGFLIVALAITLRVVHHRGLGSLVGPTALAAAQFLRCCRALLPLFLLFVLMPAPDEYRLSLNMAPLLWLLFLPVALPLVLIQISAEELVFRGYLQSQLAARFSHPAVWIGLPSMMFAIIHYDAAMAGPNAWLLVIWAGMFGAAAADLTARAGTLGPACALHFVNNVFAILVMAPHGTLDGLALFTYPMDLADPSLPWYVLPTELLFTLCGWLLLRIALRA